MRSFVVKLPFPWSRGWTEEDLAGRAKTDPLKLEISRQIRKESTMTIPWRAHRLQMGNANTLRNRLQLMRGMVCPLVWSDHIPPFSRASRRNAATLSVFATVFLVAKSRLPNGMGQAGKRNGAGRQKVIKNLRFLVPFRGQSSLGCDSAVPRSSLLVSVRNRNSSGLLFWPKSAVWFT